MANVNNPLGIDDEGFLVASIIDRCPKVMMLRELMMNAIEAASLTTEGPGTVWIGATEIDGVEKLTIRNTGPGMDAKILLRMSDLAASIGKAKGLTENFGMGAKVASLPSNPLGVRFRSCAKGRVFETLIGKSDGVYSRLARKARDGQMLDVVEVTEVFPAETLSADWTEVVLLGKSADQDTVVDPYSGDPVVYAFWIPQALYHRFFRIPENVNIEIAEGLHWLKGVQLFQTIAKREPHAFGRVETIESSNGVKIHYIYDPAHPDRPWENQSSENALQSSASLSGIVYRNEIYDLRLGSAWMSESPKFGITFSARHISVLVELPDDYPAIPDVYRQALRYDEGEQAHIELDHFIDRVRTGRPEWLREILNGIAQQAAPSQKVKDELSRFRRELGLLLYEHIEHAPDAMPSQEELANWKEPDLEIVELEDERDINDRWLNGRAACYYAASRQLFINTRYESFPQLTDKLISQAQREGWFSYGAEDIRLLAAAIARETLILRIGRALFYGLAKASDPERWQKGHIEKAMSPETFSIVADEWRERAAEALGTLRTRLGMGEDAAVVSRQMAKDPVAERARGPIPEPAASPITIPSAPDFLADIKPVATADGRAPKAERAPALAPLTPRFRIRRISELS